MSGKIIDSSKLMSLIETKMADQHYISFPGLRCAIDQVAPVTGITDRERAVIMAYTGVAMLVGDKRSIFYGYVEEKLGRPVWTHELAYIEVQEELKDAARDDFLKLCSGTKEPDLRNNSKESKEDKAESEDREWQLNEALNGRR